MRSLGGERQRPSVGLGSMEMCPSTDVSWLGHAAPLFSMRRVSKKWVIQVVLTRQGVRVYCAAWGNKEEACIAKRTSNQSGSCCCALVQLFGPGLYLANPPLPLGSSAPASARASPRFETVIALICSVLRARDKNIRVYIHTYYATEGL